MTETKTMPKSTPVPVPESRINFNTLKKVARKVLAYVPGLIIFGLIGLYYVQLSHMGG